MADTNVSLIDLKALAEPAGKVIDAIRATIGTLYAPTHTRRMAQAEADAAVIQAKSKGEIQEIEDRISERLRKQRFRRQKNIEAISDKAVEVAQALPGPVSKGPVDEDWMWNFFEQCQDVSNEQMQTLWARLLAGEVARPGSFSPRSVALVKLLRPHEAQIFTRFCTCVWRVGDAPEDRVPILYTQADLPGTLSISYVEYLQLQSLGLVQYSTTDFYVNLGANPARVRYFDQTYEIKFPEGQPLVLGKSLLSDIGRELVLLAGATPSETYLARTLASFPAKNGGATLTRVESS